MQSVHDFMSHDHDRLDAILAEFRGEDDKARAKELFARFDEGLRAHIAWEEGILFPPFEERTGMVNAGPTAVMRAEHLQIKECLQAIGEVMETGDREDRVRDLIAVLKPHNDKEENILYPWLDQEFSSEEVSAVMDQIRASKPAS